MKRTRQTRERALLSELPSHPSRGLRVAWRQSGMHAGGTDKGLPQEGVRVAPRQARNDGAGAKGLRNAAHGEDQRGIRAAQIGAGVTPVASRCRTIREAPSRRFRAASAAPEPRKHGPLNDHRWIPDRRNQRPDDLDSRGIDLMSRPLPSAPQRHSRHDLEPRLISPERPAVYPSRRRT